MGEKIRDIGLLEWIEGLPTLHRAKIEFKALQEKLRVARGALEEIAVQCPICFARKERCNICIATEVLKALQPHEGGDDEI